MSLRKFMHPRNKYKKMPDFKELSLLYPEFRNVAITDITGKIKVDFRNEETLRVLAKVLLKHDFNLEVNIPPNKLVPTLPLRLNYILWIEDLIKYASLGEMDEVMGIDIGTGAICIYPLLLAKIYGTRMIATEVDETSVETAVQHIENNNLQHLIKVVKVDEENILKDIVKDCTVCHFTMCNPPFFEMKGFPKVMKRLPPRNAPTGNESELTVQGGERAFVTQMIEESMKLKEKVHIYTTMFGRRSNLLFLLKFLKRSNIENATWTEFCQGHTKRWGLAWTFLSKDVIDLTKAPVIRKSGDYIVRLLKQQRPTEMQFPLSQKFPSFDDLIHFLEETMEELNIEIRELNLPIDDFNGWSCQLIAQNDTWSHARRKRRLAQKQTIRPSECDTSTAEQAEKSSLNNKYKSTTDEEQKIAAPAEEAVAKDPLLVCNFFAEVIEREECEDDGVKISMMFEKGNGGRNALETFRQYLINKLDIREYFQKQNASPSKKKRKRLKRSESETNLEQVENLSGGNRTDDSL